MLTALLMAACSSAASPPVSATAPAAPNATTFTSARYHYSLMLPPGWQTVEAQTMWDGTGAPSSDGPIVDQLIGPAVPGRCAVVFECGPVAWAFAAPTTKPLAAYAKDRVAADAAEHPCPTTPETEDQLQIDGEPGLVQSKHCPAAGGMLVLTAVTVHNGVGYAFYLQDASRDPVAEPADRSDFLALLGTVRLPR
jgi:hypothetical protein